MRERLRGDASDATRVWPDGQDLAYPHRCSSALIQTGSSVI